MPCSSRPATKVSLDARITRVLFQLVPDPYVVLGLFLNRVMAAKQTWAQLFERRLRKTWSYINQYNLH